MNINIQEAAPLSQLLTTNQKIQQEIAAVAAGEFLPVIEYFNTLEGEGINVGRPKLLVRLGGCLVGCTNCDTKYSWGLKNSTMWTPKELAHELAEHAADFTREISITGGEPLHYQRLCLELISELQNRGFRVYMETSGLYWSPEVFAALNGINFDIKTPSCGVELTTENIERLNSVYTIYEGKAQIKCVVSDVNDIAFLERNFPDLVYGHHRTPLILTPAAGTMNTPQEIAQKVVMITDYPWSSVPNIRVIAQQHVLLSYR